MLANGAYQELHNQGITIPDQIAVIGFNENIYAQTCIPSQSSVKLNLYERNWKAVEILIDQIKGSPIPDNVLVPSTLAIRQSCGCPPIGIRAIETLNSLIPLEPLDTTSSHTKIKDQLIAEVQEALKQSVTSLYFGKIVEFIDGFLTQMNDFTKKSFLPQFGEILHHLARQKDDLSQWHWALNVLSQRLDAIVSEAHRSKAA